MSKYEFTKQLETGNAIIDKEHRELTVLRQCLSPLVSGVYSQGRFH